jgi:DMSO reductase anchor subunit
VMIYVVTRRPHWRARFVAPRFAVTTVLCGTAATLLTSPRSSSALSLVLSATVLIAVVGGAFLERRQFFR